MGTTSDLGARLGSPRHAHRVPRNADFGQRMIGCHRLGKFRSSSVAKLIVVENELCRAERSRAGITPTVNARLIASPRHACIVAPQQTLFSVLLVASAFASSTAPASPISSLLRSS